ncbi:hypothetical protein CCZ01_08060 [Helicobacter monodelphidis]|uniref:hypothetical protein n=1 Tax=Helicobacter sp. 15-1451 TaxID=2004995 RepID=UPI000DCEF5ED|nr:hypothetical protein [Helicobacter sp. 15-1451]RAX56884.1 hypothetical protein CCZ01_08060 [Helicobacter sp. 15-1451]
MLRIFIFTCCIFSLFFGHIVSAAVDQQRQIQKAREEILNNLEGESGAEIEEIIVDEEGNILESPPIEQQQAEVSKSELPTEQQSAPTKEIPSLANPTSPSVNPLEETPTLPPEPNIGQSENLPHSEELIPQSLHLSFLNPPKRSLYVNEVVALEFKLVVLGQVDGAIENEFIEENGGVRVLNPESPWRQNNDGSFHNIFYVQIQAANFKIPRLKVTIAGQDSVIEGEIEGFSAQALPLTGNPYFSGVVAQEMKMNDYKITHYDAENNLAVFALSALISNLAEMKIGQYPKQGIESGTLNPESSSMIFYVVFPKNIENIIFDYFSLDDFQFHRVSIPNVPVDEKVSTQSDLKPKRSVSLLSLAVGGGVIFFMLLIFAFTRSYLSLIVIVLVVAYILTDIFVSDHAKLLPNAEVKILPTHNSTVIMRQEKPLEVEIIGRRGDYYKIVTQDERIGWVRKEEIDNR